MGKDGSSLPRIISGQAVVVQRLAQHVLSLGRVHPIIHVAGAVTDTDETYGAYVAVGFFDNTQK